jgi:hypothetical protein
MHEWEAIRAVKQNKAEKRDQADRSESVEPYWPTKQCQQVTMGDLKLRQFKQAVKHEGLSLATSPGLQVHNTIHFYNKWLKLRSYLFICFPAHIHNPTILT